MLGNPTARSHTIPGIFADLAIRLPKALAQAYAAHEATIQGLDALGVSDQAINAAIRASLAAGNDPATDPDVTAVLTRRSIGERAHGIRQEADDELAAIQREQATNLIPLLRPVFNQAAQDLKEAHAQLGTPTLNAEAAVKAGGQASEAWAKATKANHTLALVNQAWGLACLASGRTPFAPATLFRFVAPTQQQWTEFWTGRNPHVDPTPYEMVAGGLDLTLADLDEAFTRRAIATTLAKAG